MTLRDGQQGRLGFCGKPRLQQEGPAQLQESDMLRSRCRASVLLACCLFVPACLDNDAVTPNPPAPTLNGLRVDLNPYNALSILAVFEPQDADSARVVYWAA